MSAECNVQLSRRKPLKTVRAQNAAALREVEAWNAKVAVGAEVCVHKDNGEKVRTRVDTFALVMGGSAVAWFEGISGAYAIDHAHPIEAAHA